MKQRNYIHTTDIHNTNAAKEVLPFIFKKFNGNTIIDIGCGTGSWLSVAKELGAKIKGIDGNYIDKNMLCIDENEFQIHDLTLPLIFEEKYDLAICLEVVEHLPESSAEIIVKTLTNSSDVILFSAAIPNQGGQNHINEQWPNYWQKYFGVKGFFPIDLLRPQFWENPKVDWWYKQNMMIYANKKAIERYNLSHCKSIPAYIHPDLFQVKLDEIKSRQNHVHSISQNFKNLLKSIIKW